MQNITRRSVCVCVREPRLVWENSSLTQQLGSIIATVVAFKTQPLFIFLCK